MITQEFRFFNRAAIHGTGEVSLHSLRKIRIDKESLFGYNPHLMETTLNPSRSSTLKNMVLIGAAWFWMNAFFSFNMASVPLFFNERIEQK